MAKKTERQKLIHKLDAAVRERCRQRDGGKCRKCGKSFEDNEVHHVVKRRNLAVRWDLDNLILLCKWDCHPWAEAQPIDFKAWFGLCYPERAGHIEKERKSYRRWYDSDLEDLLKEIKDG